jgi:hypothetical protein
MPLSDDETKLIKEQVSDLTQEQREMLFSLKEARMQLKAEVAEQLTIHQKLVQELEIYKWVIRFLFIILLGGSIYGFLHFVNFVDDRIGDRVKKSDKLAQAISFAQLGQWQPALKTFDVFFYDYKATNPSPDGEYLEFLYEKWVWILSQHDAQKNPNTWVGEAEWKTLNDEREFRQSILEQSASNLNEAVATNLAYCILKFETRDAIENARSFFEQALTATKMRQSGQSNEIRTDTAPHLIQLATIDLVEGNRPQAQKEIKEAAQADPAVLTRDLDSYLNSFEKTTEFKFWDIAAKRVGVSDLGQRLREAYKAAKAESSGKWP